MPKFYRESTPEDTIFLLKTGSFRKEQECENKSAYHLYQHGKHFYATDESYFLRTKKLASHILDGLNVCADISSNFISGDIFFSSGPDDWVVVRK